MEGKDIIAVIAICLTAFGMIVGSFWIIINALLKKSGDLGKSYDIGLKDRINAVKELVAKDTRNLEKSNIKTEDKVDKLEEKFSTLLTTVEANTKTNSALVTELRIENKNSVTKNILLEKTLDQRTKEYEETLDRKNADQKISVKRIADSIQDLINERAVKKDVMEYQNETGERLGALEKKTEHLDDLDVHRELKELRKRQDAFESFKDAQCKEKAMVTEMRKLSDESSSTSKTT